MYPRHAPRLKPLQFGTLKRTTVHSAQTLVSDTHFALLNVFINVMMSQKATRRTCQDAGDEGLTGDRCFA